MVCQSKVNCGPLFKKHCAFLFINIDQGSFSQTLFNRLKKQRISDTVIKLLLDKSVKRNAGRLCQWNNCIGGSTQRSHHPKYSLISERIDESNVLIQDRKAYH